MSALGRFMLIFATIPAAVVAAQTDGASGPAPQRMQEKLLRGVVAVPISGHRVYISWRLLESDAENVAFNIDRMTAGADRSVRINKEPITATTDFIDADPPQGEVTYTVTPGSGVAPVIIAGYATIRLPADPRDYISIKLDGGHTFQKVAIADLDGDGNHDYVIKQPLENIDPYEKFWKKSPGTYKLEAYRSDGKFLWRYDMGWSIEQGMWYSPYIAYDFDGDGRADVAVKAGEGDPRDADGRVKTGPEYLLILDGMTGKERTRLDWPSREGFSDYNYYCRNQIGMAFLDGKTPAVLVERGTYNTIKLIAYQFRDNRLRRLWAWNDSQGGRDYRGQGAHCIRAADIDDDGRDEVIIGSAAIDDDGKALWCTKLGHPDHVYVGDLDPDRPGLEIYYGIETRQKQNGMCMVDAATGKILWGFDKPTRHVHSHGLCSDIDPAHPGWECYGADTDANKDFAFGVLFDCKGKVLGSISDPKAVLGGFGPYAAYWDADHQRELIGRRQIVKYGGESLAKIEGTVIAVADVIGDWREEIITSLPGEMRIYTSTIPAKDRRIALMRDPIYRLDVVTGSQAYYQTPCLREPPK